MTWYHTIDDRILRLIERRPDGVGPEQWAFCIHWTWNLHGNHGVQRDFDATHRDAFVAEFDRRLKGRVDLKTIDWIWDQYVEHSKGGAHYSRLYRPTDPERLYRLRQGELGHYGLQDWQRIRKAAGMKTQ